MVVVQSQAFGSVKCGHVFKYLPGKRAKQVCITGTSLNLKMLVGPRWKLLLYALASQPVLLVGSGSRTCNCQVQECCKGISMGLALSYARAHHLVCFYIDDG